MTALDGTKIPAPPWANLQNALKDGASDGYNWLNQDADFGHWGTYDYQRNGSIFINAYTPISNYAVGIGLYGAGYSRQDAINHAALFANFKSGNSGDPAQAQWQGRGWDTANSGACNPP